MSSHEFSYILFGSLVVDLENYGPAQTCGLAVPLLDDLQLDFQFVVHLKPAGHFEAGRAAGVGDLSQELPVESHISRAAERVEHDPEPRAGADIRRRMEFPAEAHAAAKVAEQGLPGGGQANRSGRW